MNLIFPFTFALALAFPYVSLAASHYVRAGASGNGSSWANAYGKLPDKLVRGDTYYIADGTYGSYVFDDAEAGTKTVVVKKATTNDHGISTGWQSSYGDGSAIFRSWNFKTGYWKINGQKGQWAGAIYGVPGLPGYVPYGIRVLMKSASKGAKLIRIGTFGSPQKHISLSHVEAAFTNAPGSASAWGESQDIVYAVTGEFTCSYCWFHDAGRVNFFPLANPNNVTLEYSVLERNGMAVAAGLGHQHSELYSSEGGDNHVFRYNVIRDWRSTGGLILHDDNGTAPPLTNWKAYGNLFTCTGYFKSGDANGVINTLSDSRNTSAYIYNNTFVDLKYGASILNFGSYKTRAIRNNLFYNCRRQKTGTLLGGSNHDYNWFFNSGEQSEPNMQIGAGDPFVNRSAGDFRLAAPSKAGDAAIGNIYASDMLGKARGADGCWDRGAFEYVKGGTRIHIIPAPRSSVDLLPFCPPGFDILGRRMSVSGAFARPTILFFGFGNGTGSIKVIKLNPRGTK